MKILLTCLALSSLCLAAPATAQDEAPQLSLEHRMLVRCSAAFAIIATQQANGEESALAYPALGERGREFFVRSSARVMEEAGFDRAQISAALMAEAEQLSEGELLQEVMPVCLRFLDQSGL